MATRAPEKNTRDLVSLLRKSEKGGNTGVVRCGGGLRDVKSRRLHSYISVRVAGRRILICVLCVAVMSALLLLLGGASGFVLPTQPGLCRPGRPGTAAAAVSTPTVLHPQAVPTRAAAAPVQMGLFGLGYPELAVIGLVGIVLLGPERLVPMAKDLGSALQPSNTPSSSSLGLRVVDLAFALPA